MFLLELVLAEIKSSAEYNNLQTYIGRFFFFIRLPFYICNFLKKIITIQRCRKKILNIQRKNILQPHLLGMSCTVNGIILFSHTSVFLRNFNTKKPANLFLWQQLDMWSSFSFIAS